MSGEGRRKGKGKGEPGAREGGLRIGLSEQ